MIKDTNIFREDLKEAILLHIPHSSLIVPDISGYDMEKLKREIELVTDHNTDEIFNIEGITKVCAEFSRCFCDVERLDDANEEMYSLGRGFFYTKTDNGEIFRKENNKQLVYENYYLPYHKNFEKIVEEKLDKSLFALIVDCHSFSDKPYNTDFNKETGRPDICLGIDDFHTPKFLLDYFYNFFVKRGFSVKINSPYAGTIVPMKFYKKNKGVYSIMVEINKRLYLGNKEKIAELNEIISDLLEF
jgi:N-formylglutamate deformylase